MQRLVLLFAIVAGACGGGGDSPADLDAGVDPDPDAAPISGEAPRADLTGGGRLRGDTLVMDVQIGQPIAHTPTSAGAVVLEPLAPITP